MIGCKNSKKKHREDWYDDFEKKLINLESTKVLVTLSNYMDACRDIQRIDTQDLREK